MHWTQVAKSSLVASLSKRCPEALPAIAVLRMAEHALDELELAPGEGALDHDQGSILFNASCAIQHVVSRLDQQRVIELGIRALHLFSAPPARSL
jgi:hypothetical protein